LIERHTLRVLDLDSHHIWPDEMFKDKIECVSDPLGEGLILKDLFAPITQLHHDPDALTSETKVGSAYRAVLVMVI